MDIREPAQAANSEALQLIASLQGAGRERCAAVAGD